MHKVSIILLRIRKLTKKSIDFHQADFSETLMYLECLLDRNTSQVQKKFQDGNSLIEK